jgi:cation diffusion facilitator CzcD-associated flavoprotein CzcO
VSHVDVLIVGAGFAGLRALHVLRGRGLSVHLVEAGDDVGGTWYWNRYPGARVDIESLEYSYSFDEDLQQEWEWPERYAAQPDVLRYLQHVADRLDLRRDITFGRRAESFVYDEAAALWTATTDHGERWTCRYLVPAVGFLSTAYLPQIPGIDAFGGQLVHTGRWPHEGVDVTGKRVAIVGTGATGVQLIPHLAADAASLTVLQRSPMWTVPLQNIPMPEEYQTRIKAQYAELRRRELEESFAGNFLVDFDLRPSETRKALEVTPEERRAEYDFRWGSGGLCFYMSFADLLFDQAANDTLRDYLATRVREIVRDPATADLLIPTDHPPLTKRLCCDNGYFEAFNRDNVALVDTKADPIAAITPTGVRLESGAEHDVDVLIFATGFDAGTGSLTRLNIVGREGRTLADHWADGARTHLGLMSDGFPNLFLLDGPLSPAAFFSPPLLSDYQSQLVARIIERLDAEGTRALEPDPDAVTAWMTHVDDICAMTLLPKAKSWWLGANIPGKPRQFLYYLGGFPEYRRRCELILDDGFAEYRRDRRAAAAR